MGCFPLALLPGPSSLGGSFRGGARGGGGGNRKETESGVASANTFPAYIRRSRDAASLAGRCCLMSCFRDRVVVVLGEVMAMGRSGIDVAKRMIR